MANEQDKIYLRQMLDAANQANGFILGLKRSDFDANEPLCLALAYLMQVIGQVSNRISPEFRANSSQVPWQKLTDTASAIAASSLNVDASMIWQVVTEDVPLIINELEKILSNHPIYSL